MIKINYYIKCVFRKLPDGRRSFIQIWTNYINECCWSCVWRLPAVEASRFLFSPSHFSPPFLFFWFSLVWLSVLIFEIEEQCIQGLPFHRVSYYVGGYVGADSRQLDRGMWDARKDTRDGNALVSHSHTHTHIVRERRHWIEWRALRGLGACKRTGRLTNLYAPSLIEF